MRRMVLGFLAGVLVGASASALAVRIVGSNGYAIGWTVTINGDEACDDPYIWVSLREIECD